MPKYVVSISRTESSSYRKLGYITTAELRQETGVTYRRLYYWQLCNVFGDHINPGSGYSLMWHESVVPIVHILNEIAMEMGEFNNTSTDLLRDVVRNYDNGGIQLSPNLRLEWDTEEDKSRFRHPVYGLKAVT